MIDENNKKVKKIKIEKMKLHTKHEVEKLEKVRHKLINTKPKSKI